MIGQSLDLTPNVSAFVDKMYELFSSGSTAMGAVRGNLMLHLGPGRTWTFITRGPRYGIYEAPTDDPIDCALCCNEGLLDELLSGEDVDLDAMSDAGHFMLYGDYAVFERFLALSEAQSALALRTGAARRIA